MVNNRRTTPMSSQESFLVMIEFIIDNADDNSLKEQFQVNLLSM